LRHIRYRVSLLVLAPCAIGFVAGATSDAWCADGECERSPIIKRRRRNSESLPPESLGPKKKLVQRATLLTPAHINEESEKAGEEQELKNAKQPVPLKSAVVIASMPAVQIAAQVNLKPNASEHGRLLALAHWVNSSKHFCATLYVTILHSPLLQLASASIPKIHSIFLVFLLGCMIFILMLWLRNVREELQQIETTPFPNGRTSSLRNLTRLHLGKGDSLVLSSRMVPGTPQWVPTTNDMLARTASGSVLPSQQRYSLVQIPSKRSLAHMVSPRRSVSGPVSVQPPVRIKACLCPDLLVPDRHECCVRFPEINAAATRTGGILCISDANGMAMLYAAYNIQPGYTSGKRLVLTSALDERVLASCEDAEPDASAEPQLKILNAAEEHQGMLHAGNPDIVVLNSGARVEIRKDMRIGTCATDENGWLLACAAPAQEDGCRMLRISPRVDAGLVVLSMVGADILVLMLNAKVGDPSLPSAETVAGGLQ